MSHTGKTKQPSGAVQWPDADEIMQMAFEEGQPSEDASGYYFELEEFDLFIQRLMEEVARLNQPASAALSAPSHGEQVREVVPDLANLKADSARYQFLKENCQQDVDGYRNETPVLVHALSHVSDWRGRIDESIDAAISASPSAGSQKEQG